MSAFHLAQLNTARLRNPLDDPANAEFVEGLTLMNDLADRSPGFVWRLVGDGGDGTIAKPGDLHTIYTFSVWESLEHLRAYVYQSGHLDYLRRRRNWFDSGSSALALWWLPAGQIPTFADGLTRLERLAADGPGPEAFTFRRPFPAPVETLI